eukprot:TRINITY_DN76182_c0_g1_i1.p1 TRINITY_DN76182_c0_g1~~TRINITY_DN76182_c0_g1_i1.p1  ORF type:complete len:262 (+),score=17.98 TRINITY_DN76182_c0_g1_i1:63-788(+)
MVSSVGVRLRLVMLLSLGAYFDYAVPVLIPPESFLGVLALTLLFGTAKAFVVSFVIFPMWRHIRTSEAKTTACGTWWCTTSMIVVLMLGFGSFSSQPRHIVLVVSFLRLIDVYSLVGSINYAVQNAAEQERLAYGVRARVLLLCTLDDLQQSSGTNRVDESSLACCVCLGDISARDTVAVRRCNHVAHVMCDHKFYMSHSAHRRYGRSFCPMLCNILADDYARRLPALNRTRRTLCARSEH